MSGFHYIEFEKTGSILLNAEEKDELFDYIDRLRDENEKLRELVRKVEHYEQLGCHDCPHGGSCDADTLYDERCAMSREIEREKRELGIEVG